MVFLSPKSCGFLAVMYSFRKLLAFVPVLACALLTPPAAAESKTPKLVEQLRKSDDFRIRTQAALALGASGDDAAVKPLCDALADSNASVKVAVAAALGKLGKPAGLTCLQAAAKNETAPSVKSQIDKSIATLKYSYTPPPPPSADSKYYVAIEITNKTSRPTAEVEALVRASMQSKLLAKKGNAVAPKGETLAQGGQVVNAKKLKGFTLVATVEAPVYKGGDLSQVVRISMLTYPEKVIVGEFTPKLTQTGTSKGDKEIEDMLIKLCLENGIETFQKVISKM